MQKKLFIKYLYQRTGINPLLSRLLFSILIKKHIILNLSETKKIINLNILIEKIFIFSPYIGVILLKSVQNNINYSLHYIQNENKYPKPLKPILCSII